MSPDRLCSLAVQRVTDADIIALVSDEVFQPEAVWKLLDIQVRMGSRCATFTLFLVHCLQQVLILLKSGLQITCGTLGLSTATVKLADADGKEHVACSIGTGPVDSAYKAVDLIVKVFFYTTEALIYK